MRHGRLDKSKHFLGLAESLPQTPVMPHGEVPMLSVDERHRQRVLADNADGCELHMDHQLAIVTVRK